MFKPTNTFTFQVSLAARMAVLSMLIVSCGYNDLASIRLASSPTTSCPWGGPNDLLVSDINDLNGNLRKLSVPEIKADLACLSDIFQKEYVAAPYYKERGVDLVRLLEDLTSNISGELDQHELIDRLLSIHKEAYDAHLSYRFKSETEKYRKVLPEYDFYFVDTEFRRDGDVFVLVNDPTISIKSCDALSPEVNLTADGQIGNFRFVGQFTNDVESPATASCHDASGNAVKLPLVKKELESLPQNSGRFYFETRSDGILYVRMPEMTSGVSDDQQKLLDYIAAALKEQPILFDLRQNGGGDDTIAYQLGKALRSTSQKLPDIRETDMESYYSSAATVNMEFIVWKSREASGPTEESELYRREYEKLNADYRGFVETSDRPLSYHEMRTAVSVGDPGQRATAYSQPIVLLVDKACASSCESMIEIFRDLPNATVIGTDSGGYLHFGNVGVSVLPQSKIQIISGWRAFEYSTELPEGRGYKPDFYVLKDDSLAVAAAFIKRNVH